MIYMYTYVSQLCIRDLQQFSQDILNLSNTLINLNNNNNYLKQVIMLLNN